MKGFFGNLFGKQPEPAKHGVAKRTEFEFYKKGDVIGGKYEVLGILGKGGFGIVYLVHDRSINAVCALKTFRDELLVDSAAKEAFKKEALLWVNLERHPFILAAQWVEEVFGRLFVAMDQIAPDAQGRVSLADHLAQAKGSLDRRQVLEWAIQFCLGMEHANAHGIECHRDIKPANLLITQGKALKITDFGLAAAAEMAWRRTSGQGGSFVIGDAEVGFSLMQADGKVRCGTPGYIAPEVYRYEKADIRSDIYSFGLVLWQMVAGSRVPPFIVPWRGGMESYLRAIYEKQMAGSVPNMGGLFDPIIGRCLKPKPAERFANFQELRADFFTRANLKFEIPQISTKPALFWVNKGASFLALGRHTEAIDCFDKALAIDPKNRDAWSNKGIALDTLGRFDEAIDCYDMALAIEPKAAAVWLNKGFPLGKLGRYEEAIGCYDKALAIDPQKLFAWISRGGALTSLGRHAEAITCYDKALAIDPRNAHAWSNKSVSFRALNRLDEAIRCLDKALAIDPQFSDALYNKALTEDSMKRFRAAAINYQNFIKVASPLNAQQIAHARQRIQELESKSMPL